MIQLVRGLIIKVAVGVLQKVSASGRAGETFSAAELWQQYGYVSRPQKDAEGIFLVQGNRVICISTEDRRYRLEVEDGEVAMYSDEGDKVHLKRGRIIEVVAGTKVILNTPLAEFSGDVQITGNAEITGNVHALNYDLHTHTESGGGVTGPPVVTP